MNNEKGLSIIELIVTICLVSITTILTGICIRGVNKVDKNNNKVENYLIEKIKVLNCFNCLYIDQTENNYNISYEIKDDGFLFYQLDSLIIKYENNQLWSIKENFFFEFNVINDIKLEFYDYYFLIKIYSDLNCDVIKMRWINE